MINKFAMSVLFLASVNVAAANSAAWKNETKTLRTVTLGSDISQFPECPKKVDVLGSRYYEGYESDYPENFKDKPCYKLSNEIPLVRGAPIYSISNLPFIKGAGRDVTVTILGGKIEAIKFPFLNAYAGAMFQALVEKYGNPTDKNVNSYQNGFGQTFQGVSAKWHGQSATLTYEEYADKKDWGRIEMYSKTFSSALAEQSSTTTQSIKNGL